MKVRIIQYRTPNFSRETLSEPQPSYIKQEDGSLKPIVIPILRIVNEKDEDIGKVMKTQGAALSSGKFYMEIELNIKE